MSTLAKSSIAIPLPLITLLMMSAQDRPFEVESAYHEEPGLRFTPSQQIDWASMAPQELRTIAIPTGDSAIVARFGPLIDMFGGVEVDVAVPVPDELVDRASYFAGAGGVSRLVLDSANAVTRLDFNRQGTRLEGRQSWGEVYGSAAAGVSGGGFVLHSERPLTFQTSPAAFTADDLLLGSRTVQQTPDGGYWGRGTALWDIAAQYRFEVESMEGEWLFVQWQPDREMLEGGCQYRYELFRLMADGSEARVAWTAYRCDV